MDSEEDDDWQEALEHLEDEQVPVKSTLIVGAIDFGTTFSGWGYSFVSDFKTDPTKVIVKHWRSDSGALVTEKAPTCVLIRPDGETLEAFGYEAESRYRELLDDYYYYFETFKMLLNKKMDESLDRYTEIEDVTGKCLPAMTVFSKTIEYLTNDMLSDANTKLFGAITKDDVRWVLTVPAIWTDAAKQFMREAAIKAGIDSEKLTIALEPEAASIYCRNKRLNVSMDSQSSISQLPPVTKYMVLDAGGGTIDVTVHKVVTESGCLKEVFAASGGGWGGVSVNEAFKNLLIDLVGEEVLMEFKKKETEDWLDICRDFELKKKTISPKKNTRINMRFPMSLAELFKKRTRRTFADVLSESIYSTTIELAGDKIKFQAEVMKNLFNYSLKHIIDHLKTLLKDERVKDVKAILMVGGYSDSPMLQHAVKSSFPDVATVIPTEAATSVLKGAVIFGHHPKCISERVVKSTYGVNILNTFIEGVHPESKRRITDAGVVCIDLFYKHIEMEQSVAVDKVLKKHVFTPIFKNQPFLHLNIYASQLKNPTFVDQGCTQIGELIVDLPNPDEDLNRKIWVAFSFGGTEINVEGEDERSGEKVKVTIDLLQRQNTEKI